MKYEIKCPYCGNNQVYQPRKEPPQQPHTKCKECKKEFNFEVGNPKKTIIEKISKTNHGHDLIPPQIESDTKDLAHIIESIENPVAFASAHIFKKMLQTGDVRWAQLYVSVLDKTNKLDYETSREQQWLKQAKDMSMEEIVSRVAVKGSISKNISRQLERAEDTSPYDNF